MAAAFSARGLSTRPPRKDPRFWRAPIQPWELGKTNSTSDATAQELIREFQALQGIRYNWEPYWADIARRVLPHQNVFQRSVLGVSQAERRTEYIFESTAPQALENCAALFESMLFPRTQRWHTLAPVDPDLKDDREVRTYLEDLNDILFAARYSPKANFASQAHENMLGLTAFGTGSMFIDEAMGENLRYRAIPLQDLYFAENHVGIIDRVFRKFPFSATQAADMWGVKALPDGVQAALANPSQMHRDFEWLHVVKPRKNPAFGRTDVQGMAYESFYLCMNPIKLVCESGYRVMPYATSRFMVGPREVYGRGPAFVSLSDIKMLNEMSRTDINAAQLLANPPVLLPEVGQAFSLRPGALNYGMVSDDGKQLAYPFVSGAKVDIAEEKMEVRRKSIKAAFYGNMFEMLLEHPDMTATQALLLAQERGILLTPGMGRQQSEFLGNCINRELDVLAHAGQLDSLGPMPDKLRQRGGIIKIEYSSPLNRLQRAQDGVGILQTLQQLAPLAEAGHPEIYDIFDPEKTARELAEINGVPAKLLYSPEQMAELQANKQQAQNAQMMVQAAPQAAAAAKDLAQAHATVLNSPQPQPGVGE